MWLYTQFDQTVGGDPGTGTGLVNLDHVMSIEPSQLDDDWILTATLSDGSTRRLVGSWDDEDTAFAVARAAMLVGPGVGNASAMQAGNAS